MEFWIHGYNLCLETHFCIDYVNRPGRNNYTIPHKDVFVDKIARNKIIELIELA